MDMGFIKAGFEIVFANEYDKMFAKLHDEGMSSWSTNHNLPFCPISSTQSLVDLTSDDILKTAFPCGKPKMWGIIGGPPCQDFTMRGKGDGFNGSRGKMTQVFLERIQQMKPSFFVMENVVGLLMRKDAKRTLDTLMLNLIWYHCLVHKDIQLIRQIHRFGHIHMFMEKLSKANVSWVNLVNCIQTSQNNCI